MSTNPQKARDDKVAELVAKGGWRGLVNAKCCECVYDPLAPGTWRQQVENCGGVSCPLYSKRPKPTGGENAIEVDAG